VCWTPQNFTIDHSCSSNQQKRIKVVWKMHTNYLARKVCQGLTPIKVPADAHISRALAVDSQRTGDIGSGDGLIGFYDVGPRLPAERKWEIGKLTGLDVV